MEDAMEDILACVICKFPNDLKTFDDLHQPACHGCGEFLLDDEDLNVECPFCKHVNLPPGPLDADLDCERCGASI